MSVTQMPCPECQSANVSMRQVAGGRGTGDTTEWAGRCGDCSFELSGLPANCDGRKDSATRDWNRHVRDKLKGAVSQQ